MKQVVILFGILLILAGLSLVVDPDIVYNFIIDKGENLWLYIVAIGVRLLLGFFLVKTASSARYPMVMRILGYLFILAAVIFIFMGREHFQDIITSLIPELRPFGRVGGLLSMAFGGFIVYAFTGKKQ